MAALMRTEQLSLDVFDGGLLNLLLADAGFECFVNKWTVSPKKLVSGDSIATCEALPKNFIDESSRLR